MIKPGLYRAKKAVKVYPRKAYESGSMWDYQQIHTDDFILVFKPMSMNFWTGYHKNVEVVLSETELRAMTYYEHETEAT